MRLRLKYELPTVHVMYAYEVRPRNDHRGVDQSCPPEIAFPFPVTWELCLLLVLSIATGCAAGKSGKHMVWVPVFNQDVDLMLRKSVFLASCD
jgi:hypothetical protein